MRISSMSMGANPKRIAASAFSITSRASLNDLPSQDASENAMSRYSFRHPPDAAFLDCRVPLE
jgi:hypothetical protein